MSDSAWKTLFHPFESGEMDGPGAGERWLFCGAVPGFLLPEGFAAELTLIQGFKPWYDALKVAGYDVLPEMPASGDRFDGALVLMSRDRGQSEQRLFDAAMSVKSGGTIVIAGMKHDGAPSLRKRLAQSVPGLSTASKHHGIAMWFARPDDRATEHMLPCPQPLPPVDGRFVVRHGMFSAGHADPGSRLLAEHIPESGIGSAADFCAGWGYLSASLLERCPQARELHLFEADFASLEAAKENVRPSGKTDIAFHWHDLLGEPVGRRFDFIVMNPPFHTGRKAKPDIGRGLVEVAAKSLNRHGRLLMVANRQLPYETALKAHFTHVESLAENAGYKVILAEK